MERSKNDRFTVRIQDISEDGAGIGKTDGYIWFIKDTVIGDLVEASVMKTKKAYGFARLLRILEPSPFRTEPRCPVARACGGCSLQAMAYEEQLRFKERKIYNDLKRIGGLERLTLPGIGVAAGAEKKVGGAGLDEKKAGETDLDEKKPRETRLDGKKPGDARPGEEKLRARRPDEEKAGDARPDKEKAGARRPDEEKAGARRPDEEKPGNRRPDEEKAGARRPDEEKAGARRPDEEKPGNRRPDEEKPGNRRPDEKKLRETEPEGTTAVVLRSDGEETRGPVLEMEPIIAMAYPWRYRNKAQFPVGRDKNDRIIFGFYAGRTHWIIENEDCLLGVEENKEILSVIRSYMERYHILPYDEAAHTGLVRHVLIRKGFYTGEMMVCLVINGKKLPHGEWLVEQLTKTLPEVTSISYDINTERTNVVLGPRVVDLYGPGYITDYIGDIRYQISPRSFYQVNPVQTEKLYGTVLEYAGLTGKETVWDLYCGIGTISLFLARQARMVYGVEIIPTAIEDARRNAALNGIQNVEFFVGKAEEVLPREYGEKQVYADVIVVDPPRKGCDKVCLDTIVEMAPRRVVYVSCDPATLGRDVKYLEERGYQVERVRGCDMFAETSHVETVVCLSQQKPDDVIRVRLDLDELKVTPAESKATYGEIKAYVWEKFGLKVSSLYISQIKRKCRLEVGENYNLPKSEDAKHPQCPPEKEKAIVEALRHFQMIKEAQ